MSRSRERRFGTGIRFRLAAGLLLLTILSGFLLYVLAMGQLENSMETSVTADLTNMQSSAQIYVRQYLMLSDLNNDEASFRVAARQIAEELYASIGTPLSLYTLEGERLLNYGGEPGARLHEGEAFASALQGRAAYTLHYGADRSCTADFVMPLVVAGESMGIIGCTVNYTSLFRQLDRLVHMLLVGTMAVLALVCGVVLLFLNHILKPVRTLSRLSTRVTAGIRKGQVPVPAHPPAPSRRRDEISELSENYDLMLRTVGEQFTRIQEDRVRILQLLDSRQAFYNNVTHELKTPLTTIKGYAQLLEQNGVEDEELFHNGLTHIQHESARLHRMVIQLLEMSDIDRDNRLEPLDAAAVLSSVAGAMSLKADRYGSIIRLRGVQKLMIAGREERIHQLFINLIDNAIKYGAPEETIWVETEARGGRAFIRVINRGQGMTRQEIEHIFEPFYRTDKERSREMGSAGLGLSICMKIVREHGGQIQADSQPGEQTVFTVSFPLWQGEEDKRR